MIGELTRDGVGKTLLDSLVSSSDIIFNLSFRLCVACCGQIQLHAKTNQNLYLTNNIVFR